MQDATAMPAAPPGVRYARWAGVALGVGLVAAGGVAWAGADTAAVAAKGIFWLLYGGVLALPFARIRDPRAWRLAFALLAVLSVLFVFVMIALVMFAYMASAERGERLGVPGWQGTCIFIALLQVPAVLFERRPDLLD